jgi:hypothetical protein
MPEWLELELAEVLKPVEAPTELRWRPLQIVPRPARRPAWPVAAAVTVALAAGMLWVAERRPPMPVAAPQYSATTCAMCHTS